MGLMNGKRGAVQRHVMRGVAILFLLYTAADLSHPQMCTEDLKDVVPVKESSLIGANAAESVQVLSVSGDQREQPNTPQNQSPSDEDCFCCCAHVVAATVFVPPVLPQPIRVVPSADPTKISQTDFENPNPPPRLFQS